MLNDVKVIIKVATELLIQTFFHENTGVSFHGYFNIRKVISFTYLLLTRLPIELRRSLCEVVKFMLMIQP